PDCQSGGADDGGQRQAATEQQQHAPRHGRGGFPVHQELTFLQVNRNQEHDDGRGYGDHSVVQPGQALGEHRLEDPRGGGQQEHDADQLLTAAHRPQVDQLLAQQIPAVAGGQAEVLPGQHEPDHHQHGRGNRHADQHPLGKADLDVVFAGQEGGEQCAGQPADQGADTADAGCLGNTQQQGDRILAHRFGLIAVIHADHGQANGQHHDRGRRVAYPHAEEGSGDHETTDLVAGLAAHRQQYAQCDALVQIPALHGQSQNKAAHEQENGGVGIGGRSLGNSAQAKRGEQYDRQQGGGRDRNRFG